MSTDNYEECAALQALIQANATILYSKHETQVITYNQGQGIYACIAGFEHPTFADRRNQIQNGWVGDVSIDRSMSKLKVLLQYEPGEPSWGLKGSLEHLLRQTQKRLGKQPQLLVATSKSEIELEEGVKFAREA